MDISRRKFVTSLATLVAAPAVIRYSSVMLVNPAQAAPFATVTGLDLSGQTVVHKLWEPMSVNQFSGTEMFCNMSMVNSWEYAKPIMPLAPPPFVLDDKTVDQIIADRILKQEQQRKQWRDDPAWTIYGTIGPFGHNDTLNANGERI
jgi:hypothetical protein